METKILTPGEFDKLLDLDNPGGFNLKVDEAKIAYHKLHAAYQKLHDEFIGGKEDELPE